MPRGGDGRSEDIARLMEQTVALQRQIDRLHLLMDSQFKAMENLTAARFVTHKTMMEAQEAQVQIALNASERAIAKQETVTATALNKQEIATEKRFESVNEFRAQLNDQTRTFIPRSEHAVQMDSIMERITRVDDVIKAIQIWQGNITGRLAVYGGVVTVLITLAIFIANYATRG